MSSSKLYLLDCDGTLFKSDAFWNDFKEFCVTQYSISREVFEETYASSKIATGAYDIDLHIKVLGLAKEDVYAELQQLIENRNYVFDDVVPFFETHAKDAIIILTQGVSWFQHMKISALSIPRNAYRVMTTLEKKGEYIRARLGACEDKIAFDGILYTSVSFVDNVADGFIPPESTPTFFRQYRIRHSVTDDRYATKDTPAHVIQITSLAELT